MASAEYLAWEAVQSERHELVNGGVFAMSGAEDRHVTVTGNLYLSLRCCIPSKRASRYSWRA